MAFTGIELPRCDGMRGGRTCARLRARVALLGAAACVACGACSSVGEFVWVDDYQQRQQPATSQYVIAPGDVLGVRVWNQDSMSARPRVRADGMISLPFLNDVPAAGMTPTELGAALQGRLKEFVVSPVVSVAVEDPSAAEVSVVGEVTRPGVYKLDKESDVLKALATAGGLGPLAHRDRIFVLRYGEKQDRRQPVRVRFTYRALTRADGTSARFRLNPGDVVVVE